MNRGSRLGLVGRLGFTVGSLLVLAAPSVARADRVVLLPPSGDGVEQTRLDHAEDALHAALAELGHDVLTERGAARQRDLPPPETANQLRAVAEVQRAQWTVVPQVAPGEEPEAGYELLLRVGYVPATRAEQLRAEVRDSREPERLREILTAMLRPEGLADDAVRLAGRDERAREQERAEAGSPSEGDDARPERAPGDDPGGTARDGDSGRRKREQAARARFREREVRRKKQAERHRWRERERYAEHGELLVQGGLAVRPILSHPERATGGVLGATELRVGYPIEAVDGLELRGGLDVVFGAAGGLALHVGGVYLASPFLAPVFVGAGAEFGVFQAVTGNRVPSFLVRGGPVIAWHVTDALYVEGAVPEMMFLSANGGAMTLGGSIRLGVRF